MLMKANAGANTGPAKTNREPQLRDWKPFRREDEYG